MNRNLDAAPVAVAGRSSWPRLRTTIAAESLQWLRYLRIERIAETVLGLLHLKDLAAVAISVAPPAVRHELVAARHRFVQQFGDVDTCGSMTIPRYLGRRARRCAKARERYRFQ